MPRSCEDDRRAVHHDSDAQPRPTSEAPPPDPVGDSGVIGGVDEPNEAVDALCEPEE
jgi:hypothetical protein